MTELSTWSQDCARGLDHPESVAARRERIRLAVQAETARRAKFNNAMSLLRESLLRPEEVVTVAAVCSSTLVSRGYAESNECIELIDTFHDELEGIV